MEQFLRFDEKLNRIILDERYFFAFSYSDGFSDRLLNAELLVDYNFKYKLKITAFSHENKTINNANSTFEQGRISNELQNFMENLIESDCSTIKRYYDFETYSITDIGSQQFLINLETITTNIKIIDGLPAEYFESETEKILFNLSQFLIKYVENKYLNWLI